LDRRRILRISATAIGLLLAVASLAFTFPAISIKSCVPGRTVSVVNGTYSPLLLLNSPYATPYSDPSNGSVLVYNGSKSVGFTAYNGSTWGYFERMDWFVKIGQGSAGDEPLCSSLFYPVASDDWTSSIQVLYNNSISNFVNDSMVPDHVQTNTSGGPVYFNDRFSKASITISTCGAVTAIRGLTSTHITVGIPFVYQGVSHVAYTILDITTHYRYVFPANGGIWAVDNLSAPGGPGGGWAFSYSPCP
jgi:hypothetical protein